MKRTLLMTIFVLGICYSVEASNCTNGLLSTYDAPMFTCNIGALVFSDFVYTSTGTNTVAPPDTGVEVKAITGGSETGFQFISGWAADPTAEEDSLIEYKVTCVGCAITDWVLTIAGAGADGNSFVNVTETSPEVSGSLKAGSNSTTTILTASSTFPPVDTLDVSKDIHVNGGTVAGLGAQVSSVTNLFSENMTMTPEPSLVLLCSGFLGLIAAARLKMRRLKAILH